MNSLSYLAAQNLLFCKGQEHLETILPAVRTQLKKHGHCVVQMWDLTEAPLITLRNCLGRGQLHIRASHNGVATISPDALPTKTLDESHYFASSSRKHPLHTDGAYLNGFLLKGDVLTRVGPPAVVLIQCVRVSHNGGTNIVIDAQKILRDLLIRTPEVAKILLSPGCVSFCRDDHMALDVPVYERLSVDRWRLRFRCDETVYLSEWAYDAIQHLHDYYLSSAQYQQHFDLQEGQILLLDNFRVLHGREAFSLDAEHNRFFRRAWIQDDNNSQVLFNYCNSSRNCRAFERYAFYGAATQSNTKPDCLLDLGIRLPSDLRAIVDEQISPALPKAA